MDIIATIGPTLTSPEDIISSIKAGVKVFRIPLGYDRDNLSLVTAVKSICKDFDNIKVMLDFPAERSRIINSQEIEVKLYTEFKIIKENLDIEKLGLFVSNFDALLNAINNKDKLLFLDGKVEAEIINITENYLKLRVVKGEGTLKSGNSVTLISHMLTYELIRKEDLQLLDELNLNNVEVDIIAFSFAESNNQILNAKKLLSKHIKYPIKLIAKIETQKAIYNLESISNIVDGMMVARGDLAVQVSAEMVAFAQDYIVKLCKDKGLYSIIATELLEQYSETGLLSRPEINGLSLSISQGANALQLGKETVWSKRPLETIKRLKKFIVFDSFRQELAELKLPTNNFDFQSKPLVIAIEGPNGAGKSTLIDKLSSHYKIKPQFGVPDKFLENGMKATMIKDAHWFSSALYFLVGAIEQMSSVIQSKNNLVVLDRSIWSTFSVHAATDINRLIKLNQTYETFPEIQVEPEITIILRANYEICRQRVEVKSSQEERELDELVNSKSFYAKENQFYNWLGTQRNNIINVDVQNIKPEEVFNTVKTIIDKRLMER